MGLAKPSNTRGLTGTGAGLDRQGAVGQVFESFWNRTDLCVRSKPRPLAGDPDPVLSRVMSGLDLPHKSRLDMRPLRLFNKALHFKVIRCGCMLLIGAIIVCIANLSEPNSAV